MTDALQRMAELERRYNGPIPENERQVAIYGSQAKVDYLQAVGTRRFYREMLLGQVEAIRSRRAAGSVNPGMFKDLAMYRSKHREWNRRYRECGRALVEEYDRREAVARRTA